jgi:carbon-monoxide dehydrogenase large subunit
MDQAANGSGIGQPVRRREDLRLVRGAGRYTADENLPGQVYAVMVRSPHAHARIRGIATEKAKTMPGVLAVVTGADVIADGLKPVPHKPWSPHPAETKLRNKGDVPPFEARHDPLPADKARFVGEAIAMVVAETVNAAKDAAEQVKND